MADILCVYYSRTGKTRDTMTAIAEALDAELVEITDGVSRGGFFGSIRSCLDAVRKSTRFLEPFKTEKAIKDYPNREKWNKMSLENIAGAGFFAADRSIAEYAENIWHMKPVK